MLSDVQASLTRLTPEEIRAHMQLPTVKLGREQIIAQQDELCRHVIVDISLPSEAVERRAGHDDTGGVDVGGDDNDDDMYIC